MPNLGTAKLKLVRKTENGYFLDILNVSRQGKGMGDFYVTKIKDASWEEQKKNILEMVRISLQFMYSDAKFA